MRLHFVTIIVISLLIPDAAPGEDEAGIEFFEENIRPVLVDYCYKCHSAESDEPAGGLRLDSREGIRAGGDTGPAIVPKDLAESLLLSAVEYRDLEMPPDQMLDDEVVEHFRKWILMGAPDPRTGTMPADSSDNGAATDEPKLWSLRPVTMPSVPSVHDAAWPQSDIDRFVLAVLEQTDLPPAPPAAPETLLRRVSFDLAGLPPLPDDVEAFSGQPTPKAYEELVDRLLATPQFGERWARHWLDVVRYGESAGSSRDVLMLYSWRYRDYVIDALNSDLPFDEFVRQQIAGDLLPADTDQTRRTQLIATGLLAIGSKSLNGGNLELDIADDQIDVISKAVMGLTVSCARCHDHKFDPISTADYYALAGVFRNTQTFYGGSTNRPKNLTDQLKVYLPLSDDFEEAGQQLQQLEKQIAGVQKKLPRMQKKVANLKKQLPDRSDESDTSVIDANAEDRVARDPKDVKSAGQEQRLAAQYTEAVQELQKFQSELADLQKQRAAVPAPEFAFGVRDMAKPRDWPIQVRGEKNRNGDVVPRGFLSCIELSDDIEIPPQQSGRLELARWMTHPDHPLTARVFVNRVWQHLFGRGIVDTVNNFGSSGSRPTHPQLLDYLASRFVNHHHWSVKPLIREIVLTRSYQMSSVVNKAGWEQDPSNLLLWRANRRRLDAEALRDAMLQVSGQLDLKRPTGSLVQQVGEGEVGRNINTRPLDAPFLHRSVYLPIIRGLLPEMLKVFDFPDPANPAGQRTETNVPTQSLFLLNSSFVREQAARAAERVKESSSDEAQQVRFAWLMFLSRLPTDDETEQALRFLNQIRSGDAQETSDAAAWQVLCQSLLASAEFRFID